MPIYKQMDRKLIRFAAAGVIYTAFALYLYQPYFEKFNRLEYLFVVNVILASLGGFVLSRRWVVSFAGSFFAGLVYGFGPFMLGLGKFHPLAGFLAASVGWLFLPAVFGPKGKWRFLRIPLAVLPFLATVLFFEMTTYCRIFTIPIEEKPGIADLFALMVPVVAIKRNLMGLGFYHVPIAGLVIGFAILLTVKRSSVIIILCIGIFLAFWGRLFDVSAVIWLSFPVLCCSILIGQGTCAIVSAGYSDRRWLLAAAVVQMGLAIVTLLLATKYFQVFAGLGSGFARLFVRAAIMYVLGAVSVGIVFFVARAGLRLHWLRWTVLGLAMIVDVFLGATLIVDKIF